MSQLPFKYQITLPPYKQDVSQKTNQLLVEKKNEILDKLEKVIEEGTGPIDKLLFEDLSAFSVKTPDNIPLHFRQWKLYVHILTTRSIRRRLDSNTFLRVLNFFDKDVDALKLDLKIKVPWQNVWRLYTDTFKDLQPSVSLHVFNSAMKGFLHFMWSLYPFIDHNSVDPLEDEMREEAMAVIANTSAATNGELQMSMEVALEYISFSAFGHRSIIPSQYELEVCTNLAESRKKWRTDPKNVMLGSLVEEGILYLSQKTDHKYRGYVFLSWLRQPYEYFKELKQICDQIIQPEEINGIWYDSLICIYLYGSTEEESESIFNDHILRFTQFSNKKQDLAIIYTVFQCTTPLFSRYVLTLFDAAKRTKMVPLGKLKLMPPVTFSCGLEAAGVKLSYMNEDAMIHSGIRQIIMGLLRYYEVEGWSYLPLIIDVIVSELFAIKITHHLPASELSPNTYLNEYLEPELLDSLLILLDVCLTITIDVCYFGDANTAAQRRNLSALVTRPEFAHGLIPMFIQTLNPQNEEHMNGGAELSLFILKKRISDLFNYPDIFLQYLPMLLESISAWLDNNKVPAITILLTDVIADLYCNLKQLQKVGTKPINHHPLDLIKTDAFANVQTVPLSEDQTEILITVLQNLETIILPQVLQIISNMLVLVAKQTADANQLTSHIAKYYSINDTPSGIVDSISTSLESVIRCAPSSLRDQILREMFELVMSNRTDTLSQLLTLCIEYDRNLTQTALNMVLKPEVISVTGSMSQMVSSIGYIIAIFHGMCGTSIRNSATELEAVLITLKPLFDNLFLFTERQEASVINLSTRLMDVVSYLSVEMFYISPSTMIPDLSNPIIESIEYPSAEVFDTVIFPFYRYLMMMADNELTECLKIGTETSVKKVEVKVATAIAIHSTLLKILDSIINLDFAKFEFSEEGKLWIQHMLDNSVDWLEDVYQRIQQLASSHTSYAMLSNSDMILNRYISDIHRTLEGFLKSPQQEQKDKEPNFVQSMCKRLCNRQGCITVPGTSAVNLTMDQPQYWFWRMNLDKSSIIPLIFEVIHTERATISYLNFFDVYSFLTLYNSKDTTNPISVDHLSKDSIRFYKGVKALLSICFAEDVNLNVLSSAFSKLEVVFKFRDLCLWDNFIIHEIRQHINSVPSYTQLITCFQLLKHLSLNSDTLGIFFKCFNYIDHFTDSAKNHKLQNMMSAVFKVFRVESLSKANQRLIIQTVLPDLLETCGVSFGSTEKTDVSVSDTHLGLKKSCIYAEMFIKIASDVLLEFPHILVALMKWSFAQIMTYPSKSPFSSLFEGLIDIITVAVAKNPTLHEQNWFSVLKKWIDPQENSTFIVDFHVATVYSRVEQVTIEKGFTTSYSYHLVNMDSKGNSETSILNNLVLSGLLSINYKDVVANLVLAPSNALLALPDAKQLMEGISATQMVRCEFLPTLILTYPHLVPNTHDRQLILSQVEEYIISNTHKFINFTLQNYDLSIQNLGAIDIMPFAELFLPRLEKLLKDKEMEMEVDSPTDGISSNSETGSFFQQISKILAICLRFVKIEQRILLKRNFTVSARFTNALIDMLLHCPLPCTTDIYGALGTIFYTSFSMGIPTEKIVALAKKLLDNHTEDPALLLAIKNFRDYINVYTGERGGEILTALVPSILIAFNSNSTIITKKLAKIKNNFFRFQHVNWEKSTKNPEKDCNLAVVNALKNVKNLQFRQKRCILQMLLTNCERSVLTHVNHPMIQHLKAFALEYIVDPDATIRNDAQAALTMFINTKSYEEAEKLAASYIRNSDILLRQYASTGSDTPNEKYLLNLHMMIALINSSLPNLPDYVIQLMEKFLTHTKLGWSRNLVKLHVNEFNVFLGSRRKEAEKQLGVDLVALMKSSSKANYIC